MKNMKKALAVAMLTATACATMAIGASCKKNKNNVTVSFAGVEGTSISNIETKKGETITLPTPEKEGFRFEGWYTNPEFTGDAVTTLVVDGSYTYYAKWTALCAITLDANGGSLGTTKIYLDAGANVYDAVKDLAPTKAGLTFGAWFYNGKELGKDTRLPAEGISLKAEYKVGYTVEIYMDNLDGSGYAKSEEKTFTDSDYVGKELTLDLDVEGCTQISYAGEVVKATLSEQAAANVFKAYFNRNTYTVTFVPSLPNGEDVEEITKEAKYEQNVSISSQELKYKAEGYCLLGWSTMPGSNEIEYPADLEAYNEDAANGTNYDIKVKGYTVLYGVWQKGMTDAFGGSDYIYYVDSMGESIYLARGGVFFKGEYDTEDGSFVFDMGKKLRGNLLGNGKYVYRNDERGATFTLYEMDKGLNLNTTLVVNDYDGVSYTVYDENKVKLSEKKGTYTRVSDYEYDITFTNENGSTEKMYVRVGMVGETKAFQVRNDNEYYAGTFTEETLALDNGTYVVTEGTRTVTLDGFGTATWNQKGSISYYNYKQGENDTYVLFHSNQQEFGTVRYNLAEKKFYVYVKTLDTLADPISVGENATLAMDGINMATYTVGDKTVKAHYMASSMPMGQTMVTIIDDDANKYTILLTTANDGVILDAEEVANTYGQYYYKDDSSMYYVPMLALDEDGAGTATIYGRDKEANYHEIMKGTYEEQTDGTYRFVRVGEVQNLDIVVEGPINMSKVEQIVFQVNAYSNYPVYYWYSYNEGEGDILIGSNVDYTEANGGEGTLKLVGGFAYYKENATMEMAVSAYNKDKETNIIAFSKGVIYYLQLDDEAKTFVRLDYAPYTVSLKGSDNKVNSDIKLELDGKGGATYVENKGEGVSTNVVGTIADTKEVTNLGETIYSFTSTDKNFNYVVSGSVFYLVDADGFAAGNYTIPDSEWSGVLTLDGYCYEAKYQDGDLVYEGTYYVDGETIYFNTSGMTFILDQMEGSANKLTLRGQENGVYVLFINHYFGDLYIEFNGYGAATVFTLNADNERENEQAATYVKDGNTYTVSYGTVEFECEYQGYAYTAANDETYKVLSKEEETDVEEYILIDSKDGSVLLLDKFGTAVKYDQYGQKQTGRYMRITDTLVYFSSSQDAALYTCDLTSGTATPTNAKDFVRSFYTNDLQALNFTRYGFVTINGDMENASFYNEEEGKLVVYRRPKAGETPDTPYGFVRDESFADFANINEAVEYNGETYYYSKNADVVFNATTTEYPIYINGKRWEINEVKFEPVGSDSYTTTGKVTANIYEGETDTCLEENYESSCQIVKGDDGMYIVLGGVFYVKIEATFAANNSSFTATGLEFKQELYAYNYLQLYYLYYAMYGSAGANSFSNTYGNIKLEMTFGADGKETSNSLTGTFGKDAGFINAQGNTIDGIDATSYTEMESGVYYVDMDNEDGYTYRLYFLMQTQQNLGVTGYMVFAFTRLQEITVGDYTITVERLIANDIGFENGGIYSMEVKKNGVATAGVQYAYQLVKTDKGVTLQQENSALYEVDGVCYYVDRQTDATTYYYVTLSDKVSDSVTGENEVTNAYDVTNAEIAEAAATVLYDESIAGVTRFAEVVNGKVEQISLNGNVYYAKECTYDEQTKTYTMTTTKGTVYTIQLQENDTVIIEKVENK